jgi:NDP-sugar pyrophosphorylase family protein
MLEIILEQCIGSGFEKFYFSVNYLKEQIVDYFEDGSSWGVSIDYLIEEKPLGTAGSLQLLPSTLREPFLVLNGDLLCKLDFRHLIQFHREYASAATLGVREYVTSIPFGVVEINGCELAHINEKPVYRQHVNAGIYIIDPLLLPLLSLNEVIDMPAFLIKAQQAGHRVSVCPIHEYWLDVGRHETLEEAKLMWGVNS